MFLWTSVIPFLVVGLLWLLIRHALRQPLWAEASSRIKKNRMALVALTIICAYGGVAFVDAVSWKDDKNSPAKSVLDRVFAKMPVEETYSAPMAKTTTGVPHPKPLEGKHLFGTDGNGRDVLYQTLRGCKTALIIGGLTTLISLPLALLLGMLAGYYGKLVDDGIQYLYTVLDSIPNILLLVTLLMVLGNGLDKICLALGITTWVGLCRLVRGETLKHRDREYVRAAKSLGVSDFRILTRHILPNLLPTVIITVTLGLSGLILSEAILSYLSLGVTNETGSWGNMIDAARVELAREPVLWWNLLAASSALFVLVWAFNVFGDAIRDAIDPRLRS